MNTITEKDKFGSIGSTGESNFEKLNKIKMSLQGAEEKVKDHIQKDIETVTKLKSKPETKEIIKQIEAKTQTISTNKQALVKIAKKLSLLKKGLIGTGVAAVSAGGYLAYKNIKGKEQ